MDQYAYIRTAHRVYGKSIREIARETGHDRKTVRKVLNGKFPNYSKRKEQPYPALGPYLATIDAWLETDKEVHKKQRHTATRIYHRLVTEQAYPGSETSVRRYVRDAKLRLGLSLSKAFIPCQADIAAGAEIDWGVADIYLRGEPARIRVYCMRSKYSGRVFVRAYPCERQQAFFDAHMHAFAFFGGVFKTLIYDYVPGHIIDLMFPIPLCSRTGILSVFARRPSTERVHNFHSSSSHLRSSLPGVYGGGGFFDARFPFRRVIFVLSKSA